ncbi:MAG: hypothetical protein ACK2T5_04495 [Anaerolineales bacterium]|jgi:hypothetical protein
MNKRKLASNLVIVGGIAELLIAVAHYLMPFAIAQAGEIANLPPAYQDFVFHATIAVGFCMTAFGLLSIHFSRELLAGKRSAWVFCLSQGILWTARVLSELILPVRIPMFFLANPTVVILPLVVVIALLFLVPSLIRWKDLPVNA